VRLSAHPSVRDDDTHGLTPRSLIELQKTTHDAGAGISKTTKDAKAVAGKTVKVAGKTVVIGVDATGNAITTAAEAVANFFADNAGEICEKAVTLAADTVVVDQATGVDVACAEMCAEAGLETDAVGGGPEDPVGDGVASALATGCSTACAIAIDTYTVDAWGTDVFSKAICGYCGL